MPPLVNEVFGLLVLGFILSIPAQFVLQILVMREAEAGGRFRAGAMPWARNEHLSASGRRFQRAYRWALCICLGSFIGAALLGSIWNAVALP